MEIIILIALFALNVCVLYLSSMHRYSFAMILNVISLCLVVALAAMLTLLENILWILLAILTVVVVFFALRFYNQRKQMKKLENDKVIDVEMEGEE